MKVNQVKQAMVLAAGLGTRLQPLTAALPKPLIPVCGVPLLERTLTMLESWGVERIVVNTHWLADEIAAYVATRKGTAKIVLSHEPEILGTGGALKPVRDFFGDEPFWMVNADVVADIEPQPLVDAFEQSGRFAACWMEASKGPRTIEADPKGRITCWVSPTPGVSGTYTFCGLQLLSPAIFRYLADDAFSTIISAYDRAMFDNHFVVGVTVPGSFWDDAGTVESLMRIHAEKLGTPFASVSSDAHVGVGATLENTIVFGGATILPDSHLSACVIAGGCVGGTLRKVVAISVASAHDSVLEAAVRALGWEPERTAAAFLGTRGSNRSFWRVYNGVATAIVIPYGEERAENARYSGHATALAAAGVRVPQVLADLPDMRCVVLEDVGDDSLQTRMAARTPKTLTWYTPVVKALAQFHRDGTACVQEKGLALESPFDAALYAWERELFEHYVLRERFGHEEGLSEAVRKELDTVAEKLLSAPCVLVHRDFQSSNILFLKNEPVMIDFQGMRMGAAAYDLASLLYDPYVTLPNETCETLLGIYAEAAPDGAATVAMVHDAAVQRLIQALGAFGRLASVGQTQFTRYILPALERLLAAADEAGYDALGAMAEDLIAHETMRRGF